MTAGVVQDLCMSVCQSALRGAQINIWKRFIDCQTVLKEMIKEKDIFNSASRQLV